uniref:COMM domain-containing protein n=1 Tax=Octactis speculum TaxID=3111310 RepID=A0A7S2DBL4_9STRA|mmetsp:Transcript_46240/g.62906  ORF Transcript_46240/g.62906 Transcript_46240/m.62906 type:complete len:205 (+) Transcript_46240:31-645(+)
MENPNYNFCASSEIEPQIQSDLLNANSFDQIKFQEVVNLVLDLIVDPNGSAFQERLGLFAQENSVDVPVLRNVVRGLIILFRGASKQNLLPSQLTSDCVKLNLKQECVTAITNSWQIRHAALASVQMTKTLAANQLVDMEWKFGVTAASSEIAQIGSTFLHMKLVIDRGNGSREDVFMELSLPQFYEFMADMEKVKSYMDFLSP